MTSCFLLYFFPWQPTADVLLPFPLLAVRLTGSSGKESTHFHLLLLVRLACINVEVKAERKSKGGEWKVESVRATYEPCMSHV